MLGIAVLMLSNVPHPVCISQPLPVQSLLDITGMLKADPKSYLWRNICALMRADDPSIDAVKARTKVGRGTVQRIKGGETSVGLDVIASIAGAFGVEPWQLLVEAIDPDNLPTLHAPVDVRLSDDVVTALSRCRDDEKLRKADGLLRVELDLPQADTGNRAAA